VPPEPSTEPPPLPPEPAAPKLPGAPKEPSLALLLSLCFPGAGYIYAEKPLSFLRVAVVTGFLYFLAFTGSFHLWVPVLLHVFNAVASAGAVRERNRRLGLVEGAAAPPPPPPPATRRPAVESTPRPSALLAQAAETGRDEPTLGPDEFLEELHAAWDDYRGGTLDAGGFTTRKAVAIRRLRFDDEDDRAAALEAAAALVDGGVLTPSDRSRIEAKGTRR